MIYINRILWIYVCGGTYRGERWHGVGGGNYSGPDSKRLIISLDTVYLLWFGRSQSLPLSYAKPSMKVFNNVLTSLKKKGFP